MYEPRRVCAGCFGEPHLKQMVEDEMLEMGQCAYCNALDVPLVTLHEVVFPLHRVISRFYNCTPYKKEVPMFGSEPSRLTLCDLISELIQSEKSKADSPLVRDLAGMLTLRWPMYRQSFDASDSNEEHLFERTDPAHYVHDGEWNDLIVKMRYESRYCNPKLNDFLDRTFERIADEQTSDGEGLVTVVGPRQKITHVYRARVFQGPQSLSNALKHPEKELGPPPIGKASSGRMNAKGLSMFYGANLPEVAIAETRPPVGSYVLVGRFAFQRELRLLNISKLANIKIQDGLSLFDPETFWLYDRKGFLKDLEGKLTMPAMPDTADDSYLVTQLISDYLATNEQLDLDGVIFRSTQLPGGGGDHLNFALFVKSSQVACSEDSAKVQMDGRFDEYVFWRYPFHEEEDHPFISVTEGMYPPPSGLVSIPMTYRAVVPSLLLDRDSLSIKLVSEVQVKYKSVPVRSEVRSNAER